MTGDDHAGKYIWSAGDLTLDDRRRTGGTMTPKFPDIEVYLSDEDGNAFLIIGKVQRALRRAGEAEAATQFRVEATAGDYDHLLRTAMEYVEVL